VDGVSYAGAVFLNREDLDEVEREKAIKFGWTLEGQVGTEGVLGILEYLPLLKPVFSGACNMLQVGGAPFYKLNIHYHEHFEKHNRVYHWLIKDRNEELDKLFQGLLINKGWDEDENDVANAVKQYIEKY